MKKIDKNRMLYIGVGISILIVLFLMNHYTLYTADDFVYRFIYRQPFPDGQEQPVANIIDLIRSQINHWQVWNGRFTGHTIVQIFMQFDKSVFDIFNSLVFLSLAVLIDRLSSKFSTLNKEKYQAWYLILIFLLLWWFLPEIGKTVLWVSGSGNYLWTAVLDLVWLALIFRSHKTPYLYLVTVPLAFFVGAGNENTSPAIIMLVGLFALYSWISERHFPYLRVVEIISAGAGFLLMLLSPGSQKRAGDISVLDGLSDKIHNLYQISWDRYWLLYIALLVFFAYALIRKYMKKEDIVAVVFILLAHLACIYSLVMTNELPDRIFFGASILLILALLIPLKTILEQEKVLKYMVILLLVPLIIKFGISYNNALTDIHDTYLVVNQQYQEIREAKKEGEKVVVLKRYAEPRTLFNAYRGTLNLGPAKEDWFNQWMAAYFGIEGIESRE